MSKSSPYLKTMVVAGLEVSGEVGSPFSSPQWGPGLGQGSFRCTEQVHSVLDGFLILSSLLLNPQVVSDYQHSGWTDRRLGCRESW